MEQPPRDAAQTRARILRTAQEHFSVHGYERTTVRAVAADAGVAANLITRYFGGKRGLLAAATEVELHVVDSLPGSRAGLGTRIAARVVERWERRAGEDPLLIMLRAATTDPEAAAHMGEFFRRQAAVPLTEHLGGPDGAERAAAVGVIIMGTVVQRYVLRTGPLARAEPAQVVAWLGHALSRVITGPAMPALE